MSKVAGRDKREKNTNEKGLKKKTNMHTKGVWNNGGNSTPESYERELRTIEIQWFRPNQQLVEQ